MAEAAGHSPPIAAAIAVVLRGERLLLVRRSHRPDAGRWGFPGGKIEPGETVETAAVRECREEAGLSVEPLFRYPEHVQQYDHGKVALHFIACRPTSGATDEPLPPFRWIPRADLAHHEFPSGNRGLLALLVNSSV